DRAIELLRQALRRLAELEVRDVIGYCFEGLAAGVAFPKRPRGGAGLVGAAETLRESLGVGLAPAEQTTHDETVEAVRGALDEERFTGAWRQGREMPLDDPISDARE